MQVLSMYKSVTKVVFFFFFFNRLFDFLSISHKIFSSVS